MGRQDQRFTEANNTHVTSRKGFPRYRKRFNAKGNRKFGRFHMAPYAGLTNSNNSRIGRRHRVD